MVYEYTCTGGSPEHGLHIVTVNGTGITAEEPVGGGDPITATGSVIDDIKLKAGDVFITCPICGELHEIATGPLRDKVPAYQGLDLREERPFPQVPR